MAVLRLVLPHLTAFLASLAAAVPPALAETYKWVDDKGVVNYSNRPPPEQAAKRQVVEERISIVAPDPALGPAIAAMNARAARQAANDEADWAMRQRYLMASQANYASAAPNCPYRADCGSAYDSYYYPYAYGGAVFNAGAARRFAYAAYHRPHVSPRGTTRSAGGSHGRGAMHAGRGSVR